MASEYIEDSSGEEREGFKRGGRRGGGSRARGKASGGKKGGSKGGRRSSSKARGRSKSKSKSSRRSSARSASVKGARSRTKTKSNAAAASNREAGRLKSQASAGTKSQRKNTSGTRYSGKLAGAMKRANAPKKKDISAADKNKIRNPSKFSPQDVAAALGRKSLAEAAGKFKSRNAAYKANQAAVDAQKARFKGYAPSKRSDTSAIAGYGGINPKNMGLGVQSAFNTAQNRNETTGMGLLDSARFQVTRPEFKRDINNLKDLYGKIPTPGNLAMKALGMFGKKPAAPEGTTGSGISGFLSGLKDKFKMGPSMVTPDRRGGQERNRPTFTESNQGGDGPNNQFISDMLLRPTPGDPSPTVMPGMENLQQLQQKFGNDGIGNLLARAQQVPTTNYGYGASATAGRENLDRLTASPSYMPLSSFMTAADGGRAGYSEGGSGTEQQQRENFYDFGYDDFLSLEQYMGSAQALRDLERNANGGRIGYQYGGTGAYPSGEVYGGNYAQGGQAQSGSPMVMMTGANSGLGNVLEHYKTIRGKM